MVALTDADFTYPAEYIPSMVEILEKGNTERDVVLQPDDFIIVPSRLVNF